MKKRTVSLLLTLCLLLTLLPTVASALDMNAVPTQLEVGGVSIIEGGYWKDDGSGGLVKADASDYTVYYKAGTRNLTLNKADIRKVSASRYGLISTGSGVQQSIFAGIHTDGSLVITLIGENTVDLTDLGEIKGDCAGIALGCEYQWLTFTGTGSLTVHSGEATGHSFGIFTRAAVTVGETRGETAEYLARDNCTVTALGGPCGYNKISAGIYNAGTLDDFDAVIKPKCGTLTAGTNYNGGAGSYGVYGKVELSESGRDPYPNGNFTAFCGEATTAAALSTMPLYMPTESTAALLATKDDGTQVAYRNEENGLYTRVELHHNLKTGASIDSVKVKSVTPYTIEVEPIADASNGQIVEYALTKSGEERTPAAGWQTSPLFIGLSEDTIYEVVARTAATTEYAAGLCVRAVATTPKSSKYNVSVSTGMSVDGIAIDRNYDLSERQVGSDPTGWMTYDKDTRTLTLGGKVVITHGCKTIGSGEAIGIFCNNSLNIVLADGAEVSIDMANYARDPDLTKSLEGRLENGKLVNSDPITGRATGILCQGDLTINAADDCTTMPKLTINVFGAGDAQGIRTVQQRDPSSAVTVPGIVTIGAVDVDITVGAMSAQPAISPRVYSQRKDGSAGVCGIYGGDDIILNGTGAVLNATTIGGYQGHLLSSGEMGYGEVFMQGTEVHLKNTARNGSYRVSYYGIKWDLGYTCTDSAGNRVAMKDAYWVTGSADFDPDGETILEGTLTITGTPEKDETLTATLTGGNLNGNKPTYRWYRCRWDLEPELIKSDNEPYSKATYKLTTTDIGCRIYCELTCDGYAGTLVSEKTEQISAGATFPNIFVNGIQITKDNASDVTGNGTVSYDVGTNTLTLCNAELTEVGDNVAVICAVSLPLTIKLEGENKVSTDIRDKRAIFCYDLTFIGSGSLDAYAVRPDYGTIYSSGSVSIGGDCQVTTSCQKANSSLGSSSTVGIALHAYQGDLIVSGNSSFKAFIADDNVRQNAVKVGYNTTVKDNAHVEIVGRCKGAFLAGSLDVQGGSITVKSKGSGHRYGTSQRVDNEQYPTLEVPDYITISGGKLDVSSELGYDIQIKNSITITGGTLVTSLGAENTAPIQKSSEDCTFTADNCTVYASANTDGSNAKSATTDAFLSSDYRYVRLNSGSSVDVDTDCKDDGTTTEISADISAGPDAASKEAAVVIVRFNKNGRLAGIEYRTATLTGDTWRIEVSFKNALPDDTYKIYVIDGARRTPLRNALLVLKNGT